MFSFFSSEKGTLSLLGVLISPRLFLPVKQLCVNYCLSFLLLSQISTPSVVLTTQMYDPVVTRLTRVSLGRDPGVSRAAFLPGGSRRASVPLASLASPHWLHSLSHNSLPASKPAKAAESLSGCITLTLSRMLVRTCSSPT